MAMNMNPTGDTEIIAVHCTCGKRLPALPKHAGKRMKCPDCGHTLVVPDALSPQLARALAQVEDEPEGMSKKAFIALWSFVGVFALGCIVFVVWHFHSSYQERIAAANNRISQAAAIASEWLVGSSLLDGNEVEQKLTSVPSTTKTPRKRATENRC